MLNPDLNGRSVGVNATHGNVTPDVSLDQALVGLAQALLALPVESVESDGDRPLTTTEPQS